MGLGSRGGMCVATQINYLKAVLGQMAMAGFKNILLCCSSTVMGKFLGTNMIYLKGIRNIVFLLITMFSMTLDGQEAPKSGARLYVDLFTIPAQKLFNIISKKVVQEELNLSDKQKKLIVTLQNKSPDEIPGISSEDAQYSDEIMNKEMEQYSQYLISALYKTLTPSQTERFQQIIWQVDGLKALHADKQLQNDLNLSHKQIAEIMNSLASYDLKLTPLYRRLKREMIAGLSSDETLPGRKAKANSLAEQIILIEVKKDNDLYEILTPPQKRKWVQLQGIPIQIKWELELLGQ
jgi:Spy/CpxP family protein refolding chaperone